MSEAERKGNYPPIGDYAIIGDCRCAALISRDGSLDWLCLPRFDSPSFFAALLDAENGGRFAIRPVSPYRTERRYIGNTNVLETTFDTGTGRLRLVDLMPVAYEPEKRRELAPDHEVLRMVECLEGQIEVQVVFDPRPDYGRKVPDLVERDQLGLIYEEHAEALVLRSEVPLRLARTGAAGRETLRAGERRFLSLAFEHGEPAIVPPLGDYAAAKLERTLRWWEEWAARCRYEGPFRESVVRSALVLKLMCYAPSGAVIAAPTTSLPEKIGGIRNWDYRYCWLRDASMTLRALMGLGYVTEGEAFLSWMLHSTRLSWPELRVLYDVFGETRLAEKELDHLEGYAGSSPVRIGNEAGEQLQIDVYGKVVDAAYWYVNHGGRLDRSTAKMLVGLGKAVCRRWREPDEGIWEVRTERRHHTASKAMCWVALDRLVRLHEAGHIRVPADRFRRERDAIRDAVETHGYSERLGSYVRAFDDEVMDASLLLLGLYGYADPRSPRMRGTCARVDEHLGKNGVVYRYKVYDDGLPPGEGAFGICSFWAVECLARQGLVDAATARFEKILGYANDVGLFAEEMDPDTGEALGNFPQAYTHVGLIDAALTIAERAGEYEPPQVGRRRRREELPV